MKPTITGVIIAKNEENNLEKCLKSLNFCDEIIVVDDYSEDKTIEIAKRYTKKIYKHKLENNFSNQRNFALSKVTSKWALFLDADEEISSNLKNEILNAVKSDKYSGFFLKRIDYIWGGVISHGEIKDFKILRLAKKNSASWIGVVHEKMIVDGQTSILKNSILHFPHPTVSDFLIGINFYSTLRAEELYSQNKKTNVLSIIFYPFFKFFKNYILKLGFLDGEIGLVFAILMSFHSFLVRGKLWQLWEE